MSFLHNNTHAKRPGTFLTQREIANLLGLKEDSVMQIEKRAKQKFRAIVEREAASEGVSVRQWLFGGVE